MKSINIEDYLHSIDIALKDKTKKDIYMIYIMIFVSLFAFSYLLFWDTSFAMFKEKQQKIQTVKNKIKLDKLYLKYNTEAVVASLDKKIKNKETELIKYKDYNGYIQNKIETISFLLYDERVWGEYIDNVDTKAKINNVKIINFVNNYTNNDASFGHVLDINISTVGNYINVLKFINSLEQSDLVVDIHDLNISAKDELNSDISISVWGIKY